MPLFSSPPVHQDFTRHVHFLLVDDEGPLQTVVLPDGELLYRRFYDECSRLGFDVVEWTDIKTVRVEKS